ncbi:AfsR/SARP family transcriptional regulator [Kutzneria albida]|uniref:Bacterial transcriptional activator domain-containing protein n=1 Tax=Kutzneria albida DSM 43870 TaxID=1449976 RepID=W5W1R1_9PSEU|nr:BTAD domain-containing putative transcriptional regulator [Kutzneria albida]AHH94715.1 hypothetical protein KALB_1342 [Kutzneria albida DSM 43870]
MSAPNTTTVHLLDGPYVVRGGSRVEVPEGGKRLLALLSVQRARLDRRFVASTLWPEVDQTRAAGNLRSTLWRLRSTGVELVSADKWGLSLREEVRVDLAEAHAWADRVLRGLPEAADLALPTWWQDALNLLPGWYEDWTCGERERLRHNTLHALEALSAQLVDVGRIAEAVDVAMVVVGAEPLRESGQRALVLAHLAEGNVSEVRRGYTSYRELLAAELGVEPGRELVDLVWRVRARAAVA